MKLPQIWNYLGVVVYPAARNSSGIRWYARIYGKTGTLRANTKQGIRRLIRNSLKG